MTQYVNGHRYIFGHWLFIFYLKRISARGDHYIFVVDRCCVNLGESSPTFQVNNFNIVCQSPLSNSFSITLELGKYNISKFVYAFLNCIELFQYAGIYTWYSNKFTVAYHLKANRQILSWLILLSGDSSDKWSTHF